MTPETQKKLSGELQADLQSLLDDALNELNTARKERDEATLKADSLFRELVAHREKAHGNYWAWQGDNDDHLESLVCPVLISAHDLKEILKQRDETQVKCAQYKIQIDTQANLIGQIEDALGDGLSVQEAVKAINKLKAKCAEMRRVLKMTCSAHNRAEFAEARDNVLSDDPVTDWVRFLMPPKLHTKTAQLVLDFAEAMAEKLAESERKHGYSDGWSTKTNEWPYPICHQKLFDHLKKGDPIDVANYCAFLWFHKLSTEPCFEGSLSELGKALLRATESEAKCAEMRDVIRTVYDMDEMGRILGDGDSPPDPDDLQPKVQHALSTDCGKGWKSPEQVRDMKEALEHIARYPIHSEPMGGAMDMQDIASKCLENIKDSK